MENIKDYLLSVQRDSKPLEIGQYTIGNDNIIEITAVTLKKDTPLYNFKIIKDSGVWSYNGTAIDIKEVLSLFNDEEKKIINEYNRLWNEFVKIYKTNNPYKHVLRERGLKIRNENLFLFGY